MSHSIVRNFEDLTLKKLVSAFNSAQDLLGRGEDAHLTKFRNSEQAVERVQKAQEELMSMFGRADLKEDEDQSVRWLTEKETKQSDEKSDASSADPTPAATRIGPTTLHLDEHLYLLVEGNPKRPNSRAHGTFEVYFQVCAPDADRAPTGNDFVEAMVAAGYPRKLALSTLHWDIDHGYIRLGAAPEPSEIEPEPDVETKAEAEAEEEQEDAEAQD